MTPAEARSYLRRKRSEARDKGSVSVDPSLLWQAAEALESEADALKLQVEVLDSEVESWPMFPPPEQGK